MNNVWLCAAVEIIVSIILSVMVIAITVYWITFFISLLVLIICAIRYFCTRKKTMCKDCPYRRYYNEIYNKPKSDGCESSQ